MTKYEEIAKSVRKDIIEGKYKINDQLPLEKQMCEEYSVSRITIKKAIDELVREGLIVKRRGAGTFVKNVDSIESKELSMSRQFSGFSASMEEKNVRSEIIKFEVVNPDEDIADKLRISQDDFVYKIIRARYCNDIPFVIEYTYMPISLIIGIKVEILKKSVYQYIENELKLKIKSAHRTIKAIKPNETDRKWLEIDENYPILQIEQIGFLDDGRPFECSTCHHKGDTIEFKTVSIK